jgi:hypothetical protein
MLTLQNAELTETSLHVYTVGPFLQGHPFCNGNWPYKKGWPLLQILAFSSILLSQCILNLA